MSTRNLIDAIASGSALDIESAFEDTMAEKVSVQIEAKRLQIAQTMFTTEEVDLDEGLGWHVDKHGNTITKGTLIKNTRTGHIGKASHTGFVDGKQYMHSRDPKTKETFWDQAHHYEATTKDGNHKVPTYHQGKVNGMGQRMSDEQVEVAGHLIDEEQLNELGPETTVSYIHKATKDAHDTVAAANAGGDKAMLQKRLDKRKSGITKAMTKIVRKAKEEQEEQE